MDPEWQVADWLMRVRNACAIIALKVRDNDIDEDLTIHLRDFYAEDTPLTDITVEVRNLISSVVTCDWRVIARHETIKSALLERMVDVVLLIKQQATTHAA